MNKQNCSKNDGLKGYGVTFLRFRMRRVVGILVLTLLCAFFDGLIFGGIKLFIDILSDNTPIVGFLNEREPIELLSFWSVGMAVLVLSKLFVTYYKSVKAGDLFISFQKHFQRKILLKFARLGNDFYRKEQGSAFHFNADFRVLEKGAEALFMFVQAVVQLALFLPILFILSWQLALIILCCLLPVVALAQNRLVKINRPIEQLLEYRSDVHTRVSQYLTVITQWTHIKSLRKMGVQLHEMTGMMADREVEVVHKKAVIFGISELIANAGTVVVFVLAGYFILTGVLTGQEVLLFLSCLFLLYKPAKEFSRMIPVYKDAQAAWGSVQKVCQADETVSSVVLSKQHTIEWSHVTFGYESQKKVFTNVSFKLPLDKPVIISGANGVGKSTFLKLMAGLEHVNDGELYSPHISEDVGYLHQDPALPFISLEFFTELVKNNENSEVLSVLNIAAILSDLCSKGVQELSSLGMELSGGQRQRLALAIVALSDVKLLLLDEPTSFLPAHERERVIDALIRYCGSHGKSVIIVSHEKHEFLKEVTRVNWDEKSLLQFA